jgi:hypothetical protein
MQKLCNWLINTWLRWRPPTYRSYLIRLCRFEQGYWVATADLGRRGKCAADGYSWDSALKAIRGEIDGAL